MTRRLWIAAPLALIVMILSMGGMIPGGERPHPKHLRVALD